MYIYILCECVYIYIHIYVNVYIIMYVYIYTPFVAPELHLTTAMLGAIGNVPKRGVTILVLQGPAADISCIPEIVSGKEL